MKCGFEYKECTQKCRFFETCARNPHRDEKAKATKGSSQEEKQMRCTEYHAGKAVIKDKAHFFRMKWRNLRRWKI